MINVRAAVFEGFRFIFDNESSHMTLKLVLPSLGNFIHDRSERVQLQLLQLLLDVKHVRHIRFFDIVTVDNLLLRLQSASPRVSSAIVKLLLNSYFPYGKPAVNQLSRALSFLRTHPAAAKVFFSKVWPRVFFSIFLCFLQFYIYCFLLN